MSVRISSGIFTRWCATLLLRSLVAVNKDVLCEFLFVDCVQLSASESDIHVLAYLTCMLLKRMLTHLSSRASPTVREKIIFKFVESKIFYPEVYTTTAMRRHGRGGDGGYFSSKARLYIYVTYI